ncbi:MAG: hypothetical protein LBR33_07755 [Propionibacteriaceae bacterium]|jgi:hypothetical protein|nr:hypothetical protein [Propionibacteriaceae bacterium]
MRKGLAGVAAAVVLAAGLAAPLARAADQADFCAEYPGVAEKLSSLYQLYEDADTDSDAVRPSNQEIYERLGEVNDIIAHLLTDPTIPSDLRSDMQSVQPYFSALWDAMKDVRPDKDGWQLDTATLSALLNDEAKKAEISAAVDRMQAEGTAFCSAKASPSASASVDPSASPAPAAPVASASPSPSPTPSAQTSAASASPSASASAANPITILQSGSTFTFMASGFKAGETVTAVVSSTPTTIGSKAASSAGVVSFTWTVPANFTSGTHTVTLTGSETGAVSQSFSLTLLAATGDTPLATIVTLAGFAALLLAGFSSLTAATLSRRTLVTHRR